MIDALDAEGKFLIVITLGLENDGVFTHYVHVLDNIGLISTIMLLLHHQSALTLSRTEHNELQKRLPAQTKWGYFEGGHRAKVAPARKENLVQFNPKKQVTNVEALIKAGGKVGNKKKVTLLETGPTQTPIEKFLTSVKPDSLQTQIIPTDLTVSDESMKQTPNK